MSKYTKINRKLLLLLWDILAVYSSFIIANILMSTVLTSAVVSLTPIEIAVYAVVIVLIYSLLGLYRSVWHFASVVELKNIVSATVIITLIQGVAMYFFQNSVTLVWFMGYIVSLFILTCMSRFAYRILRLVAQERGLLGRTSTLNTQVMIIGAGSAGDMISREIFEKKQLHKTVVCFIDDNVNKTGKKIQGKLIYGTRDKIIEAVEKFNIQEIIIAIPSSSATNRKELVDICNKTNCKTSVLQGLYETANARVGLSDIRDVNVEDLLGRDSIKVNLTDIMTYVNNKVVMVTGGGGSIGSELCRQIAANGPKKLIIVDIYENNAYDIQLELRRRHPELNLDVMIASVRDKERINDLFHTYKPEIVYHAAAHKHVPLMEDAPHEAVKNNVFGTLNVVQAADEYKTKKFILISTDKAVNPTNIMGATKRVCEMIVQTYDKKSKTEYVAVRFGNVLGSNGSVIPLFKRQIENGGPVTVTHPEITRYFMTIPEAVSLVLQAGAYAKGGEIFVLDMGEPVKIVDLAINLIRCSGFIPYKDIDIKFSGLRPGEKLYEELLMDEEGLQKTDNELIKIGKPIEMEEHKLFVQLDQLRAAAFDETSDIKSTVSTVVDTYTQDERD